MTTETKILRKIGRGGMGEVFLGLQRGPANFQQLIVLKQIHTYLFAQQSQRRMFVDEASLIASLTHPNIVKILDFQQTDSAFFIVMEYVDGETLKALLSMSRKQQIPLPFPIACKLIMQACEALSYAHNSTSRDGKSLNIIHRDIGLHNLMIDRNGYVKVIDFGIAKSDIQSDKTHPGLLKGNPAYMAPDLFLDSKIDHRVDIYAIGLCLYELLTQQRAFHFKKTVQLAQIINEVTQHNFEAPSTINPSVPTELDHIVKKAIVKKRTDRYGTMAELISDLKNVATIYGKEFEKYDIRTWFHDNFNERIQERIQLEQELLETANSRSDNTFVNVADLKPPSNITGTGLTPAASTSSIESISVQAAVSDAMDASSNASQQIGGLKPSQLLIINGLLFFLFAIFAIGIYAFLSRDTDTGQDTAAEDKTDSQSPNLILSSNPSGVEVYVDNIYVGDADGPESFWVVPDKKHLLTIKKAGYSDHTIPISVPKKGKQRVSISLQLEQKMSVDTTALDSLSDVSVDTVVSEAEKKSSTKSTSSRKHVRRSRKNRSQSSQATDKPDEVQEQAPKKNKIVIPLLGKSSAAKVPMLEKSRGEKGVPML